MRCSRGGAADLPGPLSRSGALAELQIQPLPTAKARARARRLLAKHHYLGDVRAVLTAVTVPSQHYLGSALVDQQTNEIPVARERFQKRDLDGRRVSLAARHTQDQTARALGFEHGADLLLTGKDNQPILRANLEKLVPAPPAGFSPARGHDHAGRPPGV